MLVSSFAFAEEEEPVEWQEEYTSKKSFDTAVYNELKKEVELIEEVAKRKLKSDSSEFGKGYGVEYGKDYYIWDFDSVSGTTTVTEKNRRSGGDFRDDGVRDNQKSRGYQRNDKRRNKNIGRNGKLGKQRKNSRDISKPRSDHSGSSSGRDGNVGSFFLILFLALVVGAIVYFVFVNSPIEGGSQKIEYDKDIDPTKVQLSELEIKIQEAENSGNYRAATRYYFIWVMKELSDRDFIVWKKKKTNYHYISEVSSQPFNKGFSRGVNVFEYVWYGKYNISKAEYSSVKKEFISLIVTLQTTDNK